MDSRAALPAGAALPFPGMTCVISRCIGRGSNALVYEAVYEDAHTAGRKHRVLVKELFPLEPRGLIFREGNTIRVHEEGEALWSMHRASFERGNEIHLQLLSQLPESAGGNVNTFALHGTLYTLLDDSGGRSLEQALAGTPAPPLDTIIRRMRALLNALDAFHARSLLHLDVSPDNVLLVGQGEDERVLLIDYNSVHTREELRRSGEVVLSAKAGYTAPEVATGMVEAIGPATDLFAVTCVFYRLLTGAPPTALQLNRKRPPDASDAPALRDALPTVKAQVQRILQRGLCVLSDRRYPSCAAMREDLDELLRRLQGVGVSHAALWEAGRRSVQRLIRLNPSFDYVRREAELYPLRICADGGATLPAPEFIRSVAAGSDAGVLITGEGGMGKSTALLRAALEAAGHYSPARPAVMYLPLMGVRQDEKSYIQDHVLAEMHFDAHTRTMEDARHALWSLLSRNAAAPRLLLLLDGMNETTGNGDGLAEEIRRLAALPGLRMVIASRTVPEGLQLPQAAMSRLSGGDVSAALARHGLLLPDGDAMRQMLRTPMMLSLFIKTAQSTESQVLCRTEGELLGAYLEALCLKAARDAGKPVSYSVEAAVKLVLPAMAGEIRRTGGPVDDQTLLRAVTRCHGVVRGRGLSAAFPAWIGHGTEALGGCGDNPEAWYGLMVQEILWRQLGLIVRDEDGRWHVLHQILQEYLLERLKENQARLRARKGRIAAIWSLALLLTAALATGAWALWLRPEPHDRNMSTIVLDGALVQYVNCGVQYQAMNDLASGMIGPEECERKLLLTAMPASRSATLSLRQMREGEGEVIPWSGRAPDLANAERLMALPEERGATYLACCRALALIRRGEVSTTEAEFLPALTELLEADADVAWVLDQLVCAPHVQGMDEGQRLTWDAALMSLPPAQETRGVDVSRGLPYALDKALERSRLAMDKLNVLPVMHVDEVKEVLP